MFSLINVISCLRAQEYIYTNDMFVNLASHMLTILLGVHAISISFSMFKNSIRQILEHLFFNSLHIFIFTLLESNTFHRIIIFILIHYVSRIFISRVNVN